MWIADKVREAFLKMLVGSRDVMVFPSYASGWGSQEDYEAHAYAFRAHPVVFSCVRTIAVNIAQVPFQLKKVVKTAEGAVELRPADDVSVAALLRKPNPMLSMFDLMEMTAAFLELRGNAYWLLGKRTPNSPAEIVVLLRPDRVTIEPKKTGGVAGYEYRIGGSSEKFGPHEIIHFKQFNPYDDYYGQSTIRSAEGTISEDFYARRWNSNFFKHNAIPTGAIKVPAKLTREDRELLRSDWEHVHGGVDRAHRIAILDKNMDWKDMGLSQRDMQFVALFKKNRGEVASIFGVPPVMVNDYEKANYNNSWQQVAFFWHETLIPKLCKIAATIEINIDKLAGGAAAARNQFVVTFNVDRVWALGRERAERAKVDIDQVRVGLRTVNELRARDGLDPLVWGDEWLVSNTMMPARFMVEGATGSKSAGQGRKVSLGEDERERFRAEAWKGFIVHHGRFERMMRGFFSRLLKSQEEIVLRNLWRMFAEERAASAGAADYSVKLNEAKIEAVLFDLDAAIEETIEGTDPIYQGVAKISGQRAYKLAGVAGTFDVNDPRAQAWLRKKSQKFAQAVNETTWENVRNSLANGLKKGEGVRQLADRVRKSMAARRIHKYTIARTEVGGAMNAGLLEGFRQTTVVEGKQWLAALDEATRESHADADGQVVAMDQPFMLEGGPLQFPGDPAGPADEIINCRCTMMPKLVSRP